MLNGNSSHPGICGSASAALDTDVSSQESSTKYSRSDIDSGSESGEWQQGRKKAVKLWDVNWLKGTSSSKPWKSQKQITPSRTRGYPQPTVAELASLASSVTAPMRPFSQDSAFLDSNLDSLVEQVTSTSLSLPDILGAELNHQSQDNGGKAGTRENVDPFDRFAVYSDSSSTDSTNGSPQNVRSLTREQVYQFRNLLDEIGSSEPLKDRKGR
jgi:hypothetical protein